MVSTAIHVVKVYECHPLGPTISSGTHWPSASLPRGTKRWQNLIWPRCCAYIGHAEMLILTGPMLANFCCVGVTYAAGTQFLIYTGDLHIRWSTGCPPVDHRMSHPHASGNVPEVVHRMCRIRWTTGCAASGGPLDVCMRWTTRCVHAVDHWMCACSAVVCTWWKSDGQPDVSIEWLAFGVLCSLSLFMGK